MGLNMGRPKINLNEKKFGKLTVLYEDKENTQRDTYWICECECGTIRSFNGCRLRNGDTKSCGCGMYERPKPPPKEYTKNDFINFIPIERTGEISNNCYVWRFKCKNCGNDEYYAVPSKIKYNKFCNVCKKEAWVKHGMYESRLYRIFSGMKRRCYNENSKSYIHYGMRGIRICKEWLNEESGFLNFYEWSIKNGYSDDLTIERIDVNSDYCPENCTWVTNKKQQQNRTDNVFFVAVSPIGHVYCEKCLTEFARKVGLTKNMVFNYIYGKQVECHGWNFKRITEEEYLNYESNSNIS